MHAFVYPAQYRKTRNKVEKINPDMVNREILPPEEMDRRLKDILTTEHSVTTGDLMRLSRVFPTHKEVAESLKRIGAKRLRSVYWQL
jgi:hypothetical protein